jgi:TonB family protein
MIVTMKRVFPNSLTKHRATNEFCLAPRVRLRHFVVASLVAHIALLQNLAGVRPMDLHNSAPIVVTLNLSKTATAEPERKTTSRNNTPPGRNPPVTSDAVLPQAALVPPQRAALASTDASPTQSHETVKQGLQDLLATQLRPFFAKEYPLVARSRGWQGKVLLAFTVTAEGRLHDAAVAQSSGYSVLDRAAINSLRHFDRHADAARWLNGKSLYIELPVIYRLTE